MHAALRDPVTVAGNACSEVPSSNGSTNGARPQVAPSSEKTQLALPRKADRVGW